MFPSEENLKFDSNNYEDLYINGTKTYYFDYENGRIASSYVNKMEAVKQWVYKVIHTEKNKYKIYKEYGVEIEALIGSRYPKPFIEAELMRTIKEACIFNSEIENTSNFRFNWCSRSVECIFTVYTVFGQSFESKFLSPLIY